MDSHKRKYFALKTYKFKCNLKTNNIYKVWNYLKQPSLNVDKNIKMEFNAPCCITKNTNLLVATPAYMVNYYTKDAGCKSILRYLSCHKNSYVQKWWSMWFSTFSAPDVSTNRCYLINATCDSRRDVLWSLASPLSQCIQGLFGIAGR